MKVAIIGAGPIGLAAAAQLNVRKIKFKVYEASNNVGNNIMSWDHVTLYSPWRFNLDKEAVKLLSQQNWKHPELDELHTGKEFLERYLNPLADHSAIAPYIKLNAEVTSISKKGLDKVKSKNRENTLFEIRIKCNQKTEIEYADVVLDATGTWGQPNPIGSGGLPAIGELKLNNKIIHGIPNIKGKEAENYYGKNIMVIGSGHSAINSLLDLADIQMLDTKMKLHWVLRKKELSTVYGGKEKDGFKARGNLGLKLEALAESGKLMIHNPFYITEVDESEDGLIIIGTKSGEKEIITGIDHIISNTGSRPNMEILKELRIDLDASLESVFDLAPLIDPNVHSCGTVRPHGEKELRHPEKNFYIVGSKSYGRAPTFLLATGYEQVRSIVAYLDGDIESALRTELELPETGVCSTDYEDGSPCCATTHEIETSACC